MISMNARLEFTGRTNRALERVLALGEGTDEQLSTLQQDLTAEMDFPILIIGYRGDRALFNKVFEDIYQGHLGWEALGAGKPDWVFPFQFWLYVRQRLRAGQPVFLDKMTQLIFIAHSTPAVQRQRAGEFEQEIQKMKARVDVHPEYWLSVLFLPKMSTLVNRYQQAQVELQCRCCSLAAERYRLKHGRWPMSLDALVPEFSNKVPDDLFGEGPLRSRRTDQGFVVYSMGPNESDDGGLILRGVESPDLGFELWDPSRRRRHVNEVKQ